MLKRFVTAVVLAATLTIATVGVAAADPAPGGNNPAGVCKGNAVDPPSCPGS